MVPLLLVGLFPQTDKIISISQNSKGYSKTGLQATPAPLFSGFSQLFDDLLIFESLRKIVVFRRAHVKKEMQDPVSPGTLVRASQ
jgi:hypothetical protein